MKHLLTFTLTMLFCAVFFSTGLLGQCEDDDPSSRGIEPTTVAGNNMQGTGCGRVNSPGSNVTLLNGALTVTLVDTDCGEVLSWSASGGLVIDAIIVKGSNGYNIYDYAGTSYDSDGNLHSPLASSGKYAEVSHFDYCYHYELTVSKTATGTYTRKYDWDIEKKCLGESSIVLPVGGTTSYPFKWTATNTGYTDSNIKVVGTITIANNTPFDVMVNSIADVLSDGTGASVNGCPTPFVLAAGTFKDCSYEASPDDVGAGVNTVTVTTNSSVVLGNEATADYAFGSPTTEIDECITVTDNCQRGSTTVCVSQSPFIKDYNCTIGPYRCSANETYTNSVSFTANDTDASGSDECSVNITTPKCKLDVSKTASTYYTKTYLWDIDKNCLDGSELMLSDGQVFNYNFNWVAKLTGQPISDIKVSGVITISNGSHLPATVTSITDQLSSGAIATISGCPDLPFDLGPGASINCDYEATPAGITSGTNNVTVITSTPDVLGNTASKAYAFGSPTTKVDECIEVTDNCVDGSVTVCASQAPYTKSYTCAIGPYSCDTRTTYTNTVSFVTSNTEQTGSAECSVSITVPECGTGCTLTQGYWKTHSSKGPARPADPTWNSVGGPDAGFYSSGKTWYQVLWTPPAGNAYYNLAHQFIAARLNILNDASTTDEVDACMAFAANFFSTKSPSTKLSKAERAQVLACASTLDSYNNGAIGPGHCDEDGASGYSLPKVDRPLATNVQPNDYKLRLAPNPARSEVQINLSSFIGMDVEILLTDRFGRTLFVQKLGSLETSAFNLQVGNLSLPTGLYQVTVRSNELLLTEPLVIQSDK